MNKTRLEDVTDKKTGLAVLDPRTGDVQTREVSNRRAGYDFTFSTPNRFLYILPSMRTKSSSK
jgi:hypothetical protein